MVELASQDSSEDSSTLGNVVRDVRTKRGLTLQEISDRCGLSIGMLSKIENGHGNPSINSLRALAKALGVPMAIFFANETPRGGGWVSFNSKRTYGYPHSGVSYTAIASPVDQDVKVVMIEAEPGAEGGVEAICHEGYEQGMVLEGQLEITVDGQTYLMQAGDTIAFPSTLPHRWVNTGDTPARSIWTIAVTHPLGAFGADGLSPAGSDADPAPELSEVSTSGGER